MPDVRHQGFTSPMPAETSFVASVIRHRTSSALRLSAVADGPSPEATLHRGHNFPARPAKDLPASGAPALPVSGTSLLPSPGAAARAGLIAVLHRVIGLGILRFTRAAPHPHSKRAASQAAPELPSPLTSSEV